MSGGEAICYNARMRKGQSLLEYVLVLASLAAVVSVLGFLVAGAVEYGARTERLVSADCP